MRSEETFPPAEPRGIDAKARHIRIDTYHRVRTSKEAASALFAGLPFNVALKVTRAWLRGRTDGVICMPTADDEFIGEHAVLLTGYADGRFRLDNSWGWGWGDAGRGWLPFEYFDRFAVAAFLPMVSSHRLPPGSGDGVQLVAVTPSGHPCMAIHFDDPESGDRAAWAMAVARDGYLDVEDLFVMPQFRRQGYAVRLAHALLAMSAEEAMPLRAWVTYGDADRNGIAGVRAAADLLDLNLQPASVPWARLVGTKHHPASSVFLQREPVAASSLHVRCPRAWKACSPWLAASAGLVSDHAWISDLLARLTG
jgi:GNAT superfamily N-acetyltransferase